MAKPNKCELYRCGKPIHKYMIKVWGAVGLCERHYEEEQKIGEGVACIHIPKEPTQAKEDEG